MSLKAFHIFFIAVSVLLCLGLCAWALVGYLSTGNGELVLAAAGCLAAGVALIIYEIRFLKKLKHVSLI